ncbi:hypothetical protein ACRAWC_21655 [Leifsonia sp. L25]|jgi:hypothetical protein|uniref:Uncharacterized protein n=1 Tax=Leifsonia shinshuensis TaxID=150026 RepID=A0A7G6YBS7_9MICO|nr:hypothetical protein [Leifsonia shinshuensis]NUU07185.1 hypothetical protein [Leifsonia sp. C5G2]QNE35942.1 hypothetical protein F1C12_12940 [Leifsonia shinshuensis]
MTHVGPLNGLPIACTLSPSTGREQVKRWHDFDERYGISRENGDGNITVGYVKNDTSLAELRDLVTAEQSCCAFVDWDIDDTHDDLRLIVSGTAEQLTAFALTH